MLAYAGFSNVVVGLTVLIEVLAGNFFFTDGALHGKPQDVNVMVSLAVLEEIFVRNFLLAYFALHWERQDSRACGIRWSFLVGCVLGFLAPR